MGTNIRYIATSFTHANSRFLYQYAYCGRGIMGLYIKEMKTKIRIEFHKDILSEMS